MSKAILMLQGVDDDTLRRIADDIAVLSLLALFVQKYKIDAAYLASGQSVPADLYHQLRQPVFDVNLN